MKTAMDVIRDAANAARVPVGLFRSKEMPIALFGARTDVYRELRERGLSLGQIGLLFGGRTHATILHGLNPTLRERNLNSVRRVPSKRKVKFGKSGIPGIRLRGDKWELWFHEKYYGRYQTVGEANAMRKKLIEHSSA